MTRTEINVLTGEIILVELSVEEIAALQEQAAQAAVE